MAATKNYKIIDLIVLTFPYDFIKKKTIIIRISLNVYGIFLPFYDL